MMLVLTSSLTILIMGHLACKFVLFLYPLDMSNFVLTDGESFLYVYQPKFSLLEKIKPVMSLHTIQNVVSFIHVHLSFSLTYDITH